MAEVGQNSSIIEAKLCGTLRGAEVVSSGGIDVSCDDEIAIATVCGIFIANFSPLHSFFNFKRQFVSTEKVNKATDTAQQSLDAESQYLRSSIIHRSSCRTVNWSPCGAMLAAICGDRRLLVYRKVATLIDFSVTQDARCDQIFERIFEPDKLSVADVRWHPAEAWADGQRFSALLTNGDILTFRVSQFSQDGAQSRVELVSVQRSVERGAVDNEYEPVAFVLDSECAANGTVRFGASFVNGQVGLGLLRTSGNANTRTTLIAEADRAMVTQQSFVSFGTPRRRALVAAKGRELLIWTLRDSDLLTEPESQTRVQLSLRLPIFSVHPVSSMLSQDGVLTLVAGSLLDELRIVRLSHTGVQEHELRTAEVASSKLKRQLRAITSSLGGNHLLVVDSVCCDSERQVVQRDATLVRILSLVNSLETSSLLDVVWLPSGGRRCLDSFALVELNARSQASEDCERCVDQHLAVHGQLATEADLHRVQLAYLVTKTRLNALPVAYGVYPGSPLETRPEDPTITLRAIETKRRNANERCRVLLIRHHVRTVLQALDSLPCNSKASEQHDLSLLAFASAFLWKLAAVLEHSVEADDDSSLLRIVQTSKLKMNNLLPQHSPTLAFWQRAFATCAICESSAGTHTWFASTCVQAHSIPSCACTFLPLARRRFDKSVPGCTALHTAACGICAVRFVRFDFDTFSDDSLRRLDLALQPVHCIFCNSLLVVV